jgi:hypothetical protein
MPGAGTVCRQGSAGNSLSNIVVRRISKMAALVAPGSILQTTLGAFKRSGYHHGPEFPSGAVRRGRLQVVGLPDRLPIVSMWIKRLNCGWRHRRQNLLLVLWLCLQDREYEVRKQ